jgi:hypothetical protein
MFFEQADLSFGGANLDDSDYELCITKYVTCLEIICSKL